MSYFRPLRRKLGVVTLLMACLFVAGWIRSQMFRDFVDFRYSELLQSNSNIASTERGLEWTCVWGGGPPLPQEKTRFGSRRISDIPKARFKLFRIEQQSQLFGFVYEFGNLGGLLPQRIIIIPYWSIVIPLTTLSAWLLLSPHGTRKPSLATEGRPA